jgi:hypothetical protein
MSIGVHYRVSRCQLSDETISRPRRRFAALGGAPAVSPVDELSDDEHDGGEAERGLSVAVASVGAATELPVVRPPGVGGFDDPAEPEAQRLLLHPGDLGAASLDLELVDALGS